MGFGICRTSTCISFGKSVYKNDKKTNNKWSLFLLIKLFGYLKVRK